MKEEKEEHIIYLATSPSGNQYIGITKRGLETRVNEHAYDSEKFDEYKFHKAILKYGIQNINFIVIDVADDVFEASEKEIKYIAEFNTYKKGYNSTKGGRGGGGVKKQKIKKNSIINKFNIIYLDTIRWDSKCNRICSFKCHCGNIFEGFLSSVRKKNKSCGCIQTTHNKSYDKIYKIWSSAKNRCYNEKDLNYKYIGGKGIKFCDEWKNSFESFYNDMGDRPSNNHYLIRKDKTKDYNKENCSWSIRDKEATRIASRKKKKTLTFNNITLSISEWSQKLKIGVTTIYRRIDQGISIEEILKPTNRT